MTTPYTEEDVELATSRKRCDCSCHRCCVPLDAWCEDCEEDHPGTEEQA